jgi:hypothetical protein
MWLRRLDPPGLRVWEPSCHRGGLATFPPGTRFSDVYAYLQNTTSGPITLASIHVLGTGIGSVVRVERIAVVPPVRNGNLAVPMTGIGGGVFKAAKPALIQSFERPCLNLTTPLIGATR